MCRYSSLTAKEAVSGSTPERASVMVPEMSTGTQFAIGWPEEGRIGGRSNHGRGLVNVDVRDGGRGLIVGAVNGHAGDALVCALHAQHHVRGTGGDAGQRIGTFKMRGDIRTIPAGVVGRPIQHPNDR